MKKETIYKSIALRVKDKTRINIIDSKQVYIDYNILPAVIQKGDYLFFDSANGGSIFKVQTIDCIRYVELKKKIPKIVSSHKAYKGYNINLQFKKTYPWGLIYMFGHPIGIISNKFAEKAESELKVIQ